jgi:hypothetical protein
MGEEIKQDERLDSIKVSMTSKGIFSFEVKRYFDFRHDESELVIKSIEKIYVKLGFWFFDEKRQLQSFLHESFAFF